MPHPTKTKPIPPKPKFAMHLMVITVSRESTFALKVIRGIPDNVIVHVEGQKWPVGSRV